MGEQDVAGHNLTERGNHQLVAPFRILGRPGVSGGALACVSSGCWALVVNVVDRVFGGCEVLAVPERSVVVRPVDPLGSCDLEVLEALPGLAGLDELGLVVPVVDSARVLS